jgi:hypothetical protein
MRAYDGRAAKLAKLARQIELERLRLTNALR